MSNNAAIIKQFTVSIQKTSIKLSKRTTCVHDVLVVNAFTTNSVVGVRLADNMGDMGHWGLITLGDNRTAGGVIEGELSWWEIGTE